MQPRVIVIGGGLAGLTASYALRKQGLKPMLLEASDRLGGRIYTKYQGVLEFELGATWIFEDPNLRKLINELGLTLEPQYLSGDALLNWHSSKQTTERTPTGALMSGSTYHKVKGGTAAIIDRLSSKLDPANIALNCKVEIISFHDDHAVLTLSNKKSLLADHVILAAPPRTIAEQIQITPPLPFKHLMIQTHTWMADAIKFTASFDADYWKVKGLSGFVFSNYGLIREMQDHSDTQAGRYALVGFLNPNSKSTLTFGERESMVKKELSALLGVDTLHIVGYGDFNWSAHYGAQHGHHYNPTLAPHQNNGNEAYQESYFDGKLFFSGAETSAQSPGYMEGAVISAYRVTQSLLKLMT